MQEKINMSKSQYKAKHVKGESRSQHKLCVPPCKRYMSAGDTHSLCVFCLGAEHAESALEGFAAGSDGGIGDERVSIFVLIHQIRWTAPRDRKPALRILLLGQRARRFSSLPPRRLTWGAPSMFRPLCHPNMRSLWRWSLVLWPN